MFYRACLFVIIAVFIAGCAAQPTAKIPSTQQPEQKFRHPTRKIPPQQQGMTSPRLAESLLAQRGFRPERGGWQKSKTLGDWSSLSRVRFGGMSEISYYLESSREDRVERVEYRNEVHDELYQPEMMNLYIDNLPFVLRGLGFSEDAAANLDDHARSLRPVEVRENGLVGEVRVEQYRNGGHEIGVYVTDESVLARYRPAK